MTTSATGFSEETIEPPVRLHLTPEIEGRNRLTAAFRLILAIPHLLLVGGLSGGLVWTSGYTNNRLEWGTTGVLGAVAAVVSVIAWFAILFTGRYPTGLWKLVAFYLRWRVRALAYTALLRDEYPPFGDGEYPAALELNEPTAPRDRITVAFRLILAIPQLIVIWALSIAWVVTTIVAWFSILLTDEYPALLYNFGVGVLRWNTRVEAYVLLLHDQYPPFSLE